MTKICRILWSCSMKIFSKYPTVNILKLNYWLVICIAKNNFKGDFLSISIFLHPQWPVLWFRVTYSLSFMGLSDVLLILTDVPDTSSSSGPSGAEEEAEMLEFIQHTRTHTSWCINAHVKHCSASCWTPAEHSHTLPDTVCTSEGAAHDVLVCQCPAEDAEELVNNTTPSANQQSTPEQINEHNRNIDISVIKHRYRRVRMLY